MRGLLLLLSLMGCTAQNEVMCAMEAKACPDGSYVGRDAARNCEFKPCPGR